MIIINNNYIVQNEQSYIENILRLNRGKQVSVYMSFADSIEWKDRIFKGIIEQSGKDHIILSDPNTGNWYLLLFAEIIKLKPQLRSIILYNIKVNAKFERIQMYLIHKNNWEKKNLILIKMKLN